MKKRRDYHKNLYGIGDKVRAVYHGVEGVVIDFEAPKIVVVKLKNEKIKKYRTRDVEVLKR